jgi:hypothetical protein
MWMGRVVAVVAGLTYVMPVWSPIWGGQPQQVTRVAETVKAGWASCSRRRKGFRVSGKAWRAWVTKSAAMAVV